ncbi:MAG: hypothetical protein KGL98_04550 [Gammaproteobacteria bacterium]|nr:hypothetical protein [Gammaproteobacteria bacterium]MBU6509257.1 hypothetical protein [Gammaproteobacteria bacterium]MDE1983198.1 hypothetical protein [Gammaproteobacteria bacterium]MDE2107711.1 hypothetical protein [Gammaproteobacteria bacterium]MDE2460496.1 hypothetical protein [Gammaproteobacteria bacterium]
MADDTLRLPRTLVNQLLRQAQRTAGLAQGFVIRDRQDRYRCVPIPTDADLNKVALRARTQAPLAFYRSSNMPLPPLAAAQTAALADCTGLFLDIALDTKGVLQLRGWRLADGHATPLEVAITESAQPDLA